MNGKKNLLRVINCSPNCHHNPGMSHQATQTVELPKELQDILEIHDSLINKGYKLYKLPAKNNVNNIIVDFFYGEQARLEEARARQSDAELDDISRNVINTHKAHKLFDAAHTQNIFSTFVLHEKEIEQYLQTIPHFSTAPQRKEDVVNPSSFYGLPHLLRYIQAKQPIENLSHLIEYLVRQKDDLFDVKRDYEATPAFEKPRTSS